MPNTIKWAKPYCLALVNDRDREHADHFAMADVEGWPRPVPELYIDWAPVKYYLPMVYSAAI